MSEGAGSGMQTIVPQHHEILTLTELQKISAQLSGYYTGLTQGLSQEEHQAVMRFFLDNIREVRLVHRIYPFAPCTILGYKALLACFSQAAPAL